MIHDTAEPTTLATDRDARISTGNRDADHILGGGFPPNSINLVIGQPGTGKTIFVEALVFHNATEARPILYLTTLSEPLSKVIRYLQGFSFFDESKFGGAVVYDDVGAELAEHGTGALLARVREAIRTMSPAIIVIDSFRAIHDLATSPAETRRLIHDLAGLLSAYETTVFLVGEYSEADISRYPEFAVVDGIVELSRRRLGKRDERYFSVYKLRGSRYEEGAHAFRIAPSGLEIFPRLVSPAKPTSYTPLTERLSTGVPRLDSMLGGGLWSGSTTVIAGPSGSGKTTLGLHFALHGAARGEPGLYVNFQENPTQLRRTIDALGADLDAAQQDDLDLMYASSVELQIDSLVGEIFQRIQRNGVRRLVIDAVGDLAASVDDAQRFHDYMYALVQHFTTRGVTTLLMLENMMHSTGGHLELSANLSYMCDNVLLLAMTGDERTQRTVRVIKTRGSAHDPQVRRVEIGADGVTIA